MMNFEVDEVIEEVKPEVHPESYQEWCKRTGTRRTLCKKFHWMSGLYTSSKNRITKSELEMLILEYELLDNGETAKAEDARRVLEKYYNCIPQKQAPKPLIQQHHSCNKHDDIQPVEVKQGDIQPVIHHVPIDIDESEMKIVIAERIADRISEFKEVQNKKYEKLRELILRNTTVITTGTLKEREELLSEILFFLV